MNPGLRYHDVCHRTAQRRTGLFLRKASHAMKPIVAIALVFASSVPTVALAADAKPIRILFLGDNGHHRPAERFKQLQPVLAKRGIELTYSDKVADLNAETLGKYDGLLIYANTTRISPSQEKALLEFVENGNGLIPLHCASYCFLNSPKYIALVGAQFRRHGTGTFGTMIANRKHPVIRGFGGFRSWDETYVHTKHNEKNRTVLEYRVAPRSQAGAWEREPWTWVRTQGKGRVFYTAWGHDHRTWGIAGSRTSLSGASAGPSAKTPASSRPSRRKSHFRYRR